jgi:serine/threonine-protein kinase HipA
MLTVYHLDHVVGHIHPEEAGPRFVYAQDWIGRRGAFPISVTMPLAMPEVAPTLFLPWAANLLPEADQLVMVGRQLGVSPGDTLGMLEAIGRDTAGALSFGAAGRRDRASWRPIDTEYDLERILDELPRKPFLAGEDGVSMSLAGVQSKIAVARDEGGRLYIPLDGAPSTHILKPDSNRLWGSVANEAFCLTLARLCGLPVPDLTTGRAGARSYLLIARYDRVPEGDRWDRRHQEDFCQLLGLPPTAKYERNRTGARGPTLVDMLAAMRRHALAPDLLQLFDTAMFNILVCNTDAHAKNYSILVTAGRARAAPVYDVMCASVFDGVTRNLAQSIAGKNRGEHLKRRHWLRFLNDAGLAPALALRRLQTLAERVLAAVADTRRMVEAMPAGGDGLEPVAAAVSARARDILAGLDDDEGAADDVGSPEPRRDRNEAGSI